MQKNIIEIQNIKFNNLHTLIIHLVFQQLFYSGMRKQITQQFSKF